MDSNKPNKYFAFISYKREDEEWAKWFQNELENYHLPSTLNGRDDLPESFRPVFRDIDELKAGNLPMQIYNALATSLNLVIICSSRLADEENAKWVNKEIMDFIEIGKKEGKNNIGHIFPFIVEGVPHAGDERECFPKALRELSKEQERIGGNINEGGNVSDINRERAFVKVLAGMLPDSVSFDMLWNRYDRDKMERERKEKEERDKLLMAQSRFVAERIQELIDEGNTDTAIRLALEVLPHNLHSLNRPYSAEAEAALRKALSSNISTRILKGHKDQVDFARFSPNDDKILSCSNDGTLRIWDFKDGRELFSISIRTKYNYIGIHSLDFNDTGNLAVLSTTEDLLWLINIENGESSVLSHHVDYACFFHESNKIFLSKKYSPCLMVLDLDAPESVIRIEVSYKSVIFVKKIEKALLYRDNGFCLLDLETKEVKPIIENCDDVKAFSISHDECVIQCLCSDQIYRSWDFQGVQLVENIVRAPEKIVRYSPDRKHLLLSSNRVLDCETGEEVIVFGDIKDQPIKSTTYSADGRFLLLSTYKESLVWDFESDKRINLGAAVLYVNDYSFSNNGKTLLCSAEDGTIKMIALNNQHYLKEIPDEEKGREVALYTHHNDIRRVRFISDGQKLVSSSLDSLIFLDIKNDECIGYYPNSGDMGHTISLDKKEELVVTTWCKDLPRYPCSVLTINVLTGEKDHVFCEEENSYFYHASFSPDEKFIASIFKKNGKCGVILWDAKTKEEYYTFASEAEVYNYEFSQDSGLLVFNTRISIVLWDVKKKRRLLVKKDNILYETPLLFWKGEGHLRGFVAYITIHNRVKICDLDRKKTIELIGHTMNVMGMALDPEGKILATASYDKTVKIWNVQTGDELSTCYGHKARVECVAFNQDSSLLASGAFDGTVRVWDVKTGTNLEVIKAHYGAVSTVCFSQDSTMLASGGIHDFAVRVWEYPPLQLLIDNNRERFKDRPLTPEERRKYYLE